MAGKILGTSTLKTVLVEERKFVIMTKNNVFERFFVLIKSQTVPNFVQRN